MDPGGSMDYEYEVQHPEHQFGMRPGRGCPALAAQRQQHQQQQQPQPWHSQYYDPDHNRRIWGNPTPFWGHPPPPSLATAQWLAYYRHLPARSGTGPPNRTHSHDAAPPSTSAYSDHTPPAAAPAIASLSAPYNPQGPPLERQHSPPSAESPAESRHAHAERSSDDETRPAPGFYESSPPNLPQQFGPRASVPLPGLGLYSRPREEQSSLGLPQTAGPNPRAGLPAPDPTTTTPMNSSATSTESRRTMPGVVSYSDPYRPPRARLSVAAGVVSSTGVLGGGDNNVAASPTSSHDEDSDADMSPRMHMFGYFNATRQSQVVRGQMPNKRVASRKALSSLQEVDLGSLPETEKTCVICYNDFGVASPEGTVESPLRLPKCKHVFGDKCIRKWLEDSYSCPYCRDKLESEFAQPREQDIQRMLSATHTLPLLSQNSALRRVLAHYRPDNGSYRSDRRHREHAANVGGASTRDGTTRGERRAAPSEDPNDAQRRQRPRHEALTSSRLGAFDFSFDTQRSSRPTPLDPLPAAQTSTREHSSQRTPAWHRTAPSGPPLFSPFTVPHSTSSSEPNSYYPRITPFQPPVLSLPQPSSPPSSSPNNQMPPMLSREDLFGAPPTARDGYFNSDGGSGPATGTPAPGEPQFPSFGSTPSSAAHLFMPAPPLAPAAHYQGYAPNYFPNQPLPRLHMAHPDRMGAVPSGLHYPS